MPWRHGLGVSLLGEELGARGRVKIPYAAHICGPSHVVVGCSVGGGMGKKTITKVMEGKFLRLIKTIRNDRALLQQEEGDTYRVT